MSWDMGTHCYVGMLPCGCGAAIVRDMPEFKQDTAKDVAEFIKLGYAVERLPHAAACERFDAKCSAYPHTDAQRRVDAARL